MQRELSNQTKRAEQDSNLQSFIWCFCAHHRPMFQLMDRVGLHCPHHPLLPPPSSLLGSPSSLWMAPTTAANLDLLRILGE